MVFCRVELSLLSLAKQKEQRSPTDDPLMRPISCVQLQAHHCVIKDGNGEVISELDHKGLTIRLRSEFPILVQGRCLILYLMEIQIAEAKHAEQTSHIKGCVCTDWRHCNAMLLAGSVCTFLSPLCLFVSRHRKLFCLLPSLHGRFTRAMVSCICLIVSVA